MDKSGDLGDIPAAILGSASNGELIKDIATLTVEDLVVIYAYADAIVETVRQPLVILGDDLSIKTANKAFFDTFKVTKEDTYGKKIFDLGNGQWDIDKLRELLLTILPRDTQFFDFEITHIFEGVGEKTMLLNARRIQLEKYKTELILLAIEDITARRATEKLKDDFIGVASHELRTPLNSIKLLTQALQIEANKEGNEENISSLNTLEHQIDRLSTLVDSFNDMYRIQTGKLELRKTDFEMDELIDEVISMSHSMNTTHTITRKGDTNKIVNADKGRIEQVLINFITNAIKYSPSADKIEISVTEDEKSTQVSVKDYGVGIPKDQLEHVKERFFRVQDELSTKTPGLGLGLHIANEIIKDHGGKLTIESEVGKGSVFSFSLPL
jgi:two-component system, OmpR family, phosphate regulon sensor histidine kinase PhoR